MMRYTIFYNKLNTLLSIVKTLKNIGDALTEGKANAAITIQEITEHTGLTAVTVRGLLGGQKDSKLTTLLAVADDLGLDVVLVPKAISLAMTLNQNKAGQNIPTLVSSALKREFKN